VGKFNVSVVAFNKVAQRETFAIVMVQTFIQGVELSVSSPVHEYDTSVNFIAVADPPGVDIVNFYTFELGEKNTTGQSNSYMYTYLKHGT
jgi:hypothetical protein